MELVEVAVVVELVDLGLGVRAWKMTSLGWGEVGEGSD